MAAHWNGERFSIEELHRFPNGGVAVEQTLYWDVLNLWAQVQEGLRKFHTQYRESPAAIGVDAWGVDFGLLDRSGRLIANPVHYRDRRTEGMPAKLFEVVPEADIFADTGVQTMAINTLFQLYAMATSCDVQLNEAQTLLMIPDLFHYFLGGEKYVEYTQATTTQMYSLASRGWAYDMLERIGVPSRILPEIVRPGTVLSAIRPDVLLNAGFSVPFPVVAVGSHDTASAVASIAPIDDSDCVHKQRYLEPDGRADRGTQHDPQSLGPGVYQRGRRRRSSPPPQEPHRTMDSAGVPAAMEARTSEVHLGPIVQAAAQAAPLRSVFDPNDTRLGTPGRMLQAIAKCCADSKQPVPETVGQVARAAFESLSLKYRSTLLALEELTGRQLKTIRVVGGGSRNALFSQMIADACNRTVLAGPVEASALGNAMLQAVAIGEIADIESGREAIAASVECAVYNPRPSDRWDEMYGLFRRLEAN